MKKMIFIMTTLLLLEIVTTGQATEITIDANAPAKSIRFRNFYGGYHHKEFYYERSTAFKKIHDIFKASAHKHPVVKYWRAQNIFTYRNDPNGSGGLRWATEKLAGHCYDTDRYASTGGYNWDRVNEVFDEIVNRAGLTPVVEFNYMPECMALDPNEVGGYGLSCISPPKNHKDWQELVRNTVTHLQNRYGVANTHTWFWGVWNEPDHREFWNMDKYGYDGFIKIYDYAAVPVKQVDQRLQIGGPDNAGVHDLTRRFVEHTRRGTNYCTGQPGSPCEYFSVHNYSHNVRLTCTQLWKMAKDVVEVYGRENCQNKKFLITETAPHWKTFDHPYLQNRYTACWWLAMVDIFLEAADIHGEFYLPVSIHHCGIMKSFGRRSLMVQLNQDIDSDEILKTPLFNAMEALSFLSEERLAVQGCDFPDNGFLDVTDFNYKKFKQIRCFATRTPGKSIEILVYHFDQDDRLVYNQNDDGDNPAQPYGTYKRSNPLTHDITLAIRNIPFSQVKIKKYVLDKDHSNAIAYHTTHGNTQNFQVLDQHDDLEKIDDKTVTIQNGQYTENLMIHQNAMTLIIIENANTSPEPHLGVTPNWLDFGRAATLKSVSVTNHGTATLTWSARENPPENWITSLVPASGVLGAGESATVNINVNRAGLSDGSYSGTIEILSNGGNQNVTVSMEVGSGTLPSVYRINAGGDLFTDDVNQHWSADQAYRAGGFGYEGGKTFFTTDPISGTNNDKLYQTLRYQMTAYRFDLPNGLYRVVLHLAETYFQAPDELRMSVAIEGETKLSDLDIYQEVGHDAALVYSFPDNQVSDGRLDITFSASYRDAKISAIEVIGNPNQDSTPPNSPINLRVYRP